MGARARAVLAADARADTWLSSRHAAHGRGEPGAAAAPKGVGVEASLGGGLLGHSGGFDRMRLLDVAAALRAPGVPAQSVAAWLVDAVGSTVTVGLGPVAIAPVRMQIGCKQGGAATPLMWKVLLGGVGPPAALARARCRDLVAGAHGG